MEQHDLLSNNNFSHPQNLPNATASLVLGIISIIGACCYGIPGLICGIIGLVLANKDKKLYALEPERYLPQSLSTLNAGRVCSIIGIILGALTILVMLFYFFMFGTQIMDAVQNSRHSIR